MTGSTSAPSLDELLASIGAVDERWVAAAEAHHLRLTKPPGSLGALEALGGRLAAIAGTAVPPKPEPATVVVFAGDHGVHAEGVSPWPQEVTAQMVLNFCGGGAAINTIAETNGIDVLVVNAGVVADLPAHARLRNTPIRRGTANVAIEPAMTRAEATAAVLLGAEVAAERVAAGSRCLLTGDMGIANTTSSAAIVAAVTERAPATVTGRGTGIDDETLAHKVEVVGRALVRCAAGADGPPSDPIDLLAQIGGVEIGAIAGLCLGGAAARLPVIVDGVITLAGALLACRLEPKTAGYLIAGHRSVEPAAQAALEHLGLEPLIDLGLRLGEGTGAALAYPLLRAASQVMVGMATFDEAGVSASADPAGAPTS